MKEITLVTLLLFFGINIAVADCSVSGMFFYPETTEIGLNSVFIIEGYDFSQNTINSFKDRKIYLESESGELIELSLQEILKGDMRLTQALFCPASELKPNTTYYLKYSNQTQSELRDMIQYNRGEKVGVKVFWKTTDKKDFKLLSSHLNIKFQKTEIELYGCGPSVNLVFNTNNKSSLNAWYKTEVIDLTSNHKTTYYIKEKNSKLSVGHGMCSGAFTYENKGKYKVKFTLMDTDGKLLTSTSWKTFESPLLKTRRPF
jgi:hypothetical protein